MCYAEAKPPLRFAHGFQPFYALHYAHGLARHTQALGTQTEVDVSISWSEIFLQEPEIDYGQLLEQWSPLVSGKIQPIGLSAFGDIYFLQPDGSVNVLDLLEGAVHEVAETRQAFGECMNSKEWQDSNLMPEVVWQLQNRGLVRKPGQVYGFAPHPSLTDKISPETAMVMDALVWHSICAQLLLPSANKQA